MIRYSKYGIHECVKEAYHVSSGANALVLNPRTSSRIKHENRIAVNLAVLSSTFGSWMPAVNSCEEYLEYEEFE